MHSEGWLTHQFASSVSVERCCFVDVRNLGQVYEDWATKDFGKNGIILNIRRSSGQSFYILKVSKWATFRRNFRNFYLTDEKIQRLQTKVYENWATHCKPGEYMRMMFIQSVTQAARNDRIAFASLRICHLSTFQSQQYAGCLSHEPQFNGLSSHKSPVAQWQSILISNQKFIGSTPVGRTQTFSRAACVTD